MDCKLGFVGMTHAQVIPAVFVLHASGFGLGYWLSKMIGTSDKVARTNSIEVRLHTPAPPRLVVSDCVTDGSLLRVDCDTECACIHLAQLAAAVQLGQSCAAVRFSMCAGGHAEQRAGCCACKDPLP